MEQRKSSGIGVQEEYLTLGLDSRWQWLVVCAAEPFRFTIALPSKPIFESQDEMISLSRQRKRYNEISPTKKEELLLQRHTRELDSRRRLAQICAPNYSATSTSSASNSTFQQNRPLIIRNVCVTETQATTSEVNISPDTSPKGKSLLQPFCFFEKGKCSNHMVGLISVSSSHTPNGQCDLGSKNLIDRGVKNMCSIDNFLDMEAQMLEQQKKKRNTVSCREYYCYKIQMRNDENDELLHTGRAFQQYIVDMFIKLETQRLDFFFFNPELFRMEVLQGLLDVLRHGERDAAKIGKQTFLPITFTGGPRDMRRLYRDAIALIKRDGITKLVVLPLYPQYSISTARSTVRALQNVSNILINASESKLHAQGLEFQQIALGQC
ncbi:hypothetical protein FXO38_09507 [Capsicum annuum]|nr:hypothetical protein FXO38_09507 [Capsicum annuum]KAF3668103.1 hypothetical protein FXO37_09694 [Capsicum annuum]